MKTKSKPKPVVPQISEFDRWRGRVMAYCHECWGRGGFECLTEKRWRRFYDSEARPDLTEWEFAAYVVLPWCAHHYWRGDDPTRLQKPQSFGTRKAVKEYRRSLAATTERCRTLFETATILAARVAVAPAAKPEPPEPEDAGKWEQPPRVRDRRLARMGSKAGVCPVAVKSLKYRDLLEWCEAVTDYLQERGEFPTVGCLMLWVHDAPGLDDRDEGVLAARRIAALYDTEYQREMELARQMYARAGRADDPKPKKVKEEKVKPAKPAPKAEVRSPIVVVEGEGDSKKYKVFGFPVTAVLRWMGKDAWTHEDARLAMTKLGIPEVKDNTLKAQLMTGRKGDGYAGRKPAAALTPEQQDTLYALLETTDVGAKPQAKADHERRARSPKQQSPEVARRAGKDRGKAQAPDRAVPGKADGRKVQAGRRPGATADQEDRRDRSGRPVRPEGSVNGKPRVRPADEPAGRGGRAGSANPGKAGRPAGVGGDKPGRGKPAATHSVPGRNGGGGTGRVPTASGPDRDGSGKARVNGKGKPANPPAKPLGARMRPGTPPGRGKPARKPGKPGKGPKTG